MDYLKKDGESELSYILRLVEGKNNGIYDIDYCELFKLGFGVEFSSDHCRKMYYSLKMLLPYLEKDKTKNITSSEILTELDIKKIEIQKEKEKNRTIKLELNKMLRQDARFEMFLDEIRDSIRRVEHPKFATIETSECGDRIGLLGISDAHFGKIFKSYNNEYSMQIFKDRMEVLLGETIDWVKDNKISHLHLVNAGDSIEGLLRIGAIRALETGVIDGVIEFSSYIAEWINALSKWIPITYHHVMSSNHSECRFLGSKAGQFPDEDLEKVIVHYIRDVLRFNTRIEVPVYDTEFCVFRIYGKNIAVIHGHQLRSVKKGDAIKHIQGLLGITIDTLVTGHYHHEENITIGENENGNVKLIMLPSIMGSDEFSDDIFTGSKSGATLIKYCENKKGITTTEVILN
jgi:hypothetical protein